MHFECIQPPKPFYPKTLDYYCNNIAFVIIHNVILKTKQTKTYLLPNRPTQVLSFDRHLREKTCFKFQPKPV